MKRFHVHVAVENLDASVQFYAKLFGIAPTLQKSDYAKWMLDDPRINFAISQRGHALGVNHLGLQVESADELALLRRNVDAAGLAAIEQTATACCYAESNKHWLQDPQGIAWETFHTLGEVAVFGDDDVPTAAQMAGACVPLTAPPNDIEAAACCVPKPAPSAPAKGCCG